MAGFWDFHHIEREGPGVAKDQAEGPKIVQFFKIFFRNPGKLLALNFIYLLFCLPVVTIGPATAGIVYVLRNISQHKPVFVWHDFWKNFKRHFKQSFLVFCMDVVLYAVIGFAAVFYFQQIRQSPTFSLLFFISLAALVLFTMLHYYIYLLIVTVTLPMKSILKNAFLLTLGGFFTNLITTFFAGVTLWVFYELVFVLPFTGIPAFLILSLALAVLLGCYIFSLIGLLVCFNSYPYITKYVTDPYYEAHPEEKNDGGDSIFTDHTGEDDAYR